MEFLIIERKDGKFNFAYDDTIANYSYGKKDLYIPSESDLQIIKCLDTTYHIFFYETRGTGADFIKIELERFLSKYEKINYHMVLNEIVPIIKETLRKHYQIKKMDDGTESMASEILIMVGDDTLFLIDKYFLVEELNDYMDNKNATFRMAYNMFSGNSIREKAFEMLSNRYMESRRYPISFSSSDEESVTCVFKDGERKFDKEEYRWHL